MARRKGIRNATRSGQQVLSEADCLRAVAVCACFNLRKAVRAATRWYDEALRPAGLRSGQFVLLLAIRLHGAVTAAALASSVASDPATVSRNLRPLLRRNLIESRVGRDQREREITLTPKGHAALVAAFPWWKRIQSQVHRRLSGPNFDRLLTTLGTLALWSPQAPPPVARRTRKAG
jgi:DNA-binding MarR family transcriptional regulator